jgi:PKD repeat protein
MVMFNDTSIGGPVSWYWQFGDGSVSTDQNPTHVYLTPGSYTVSLRVHNEKTRGFGVLDNGIVVS